MRVLIIGPSHPYRGGIAAYSTLLYDALKRHHHTDFFGLKNQFFKAIYPGRTQHESSQFNLERKAIQYCLDTYNPFSWLRCGRLARDYDIVIMPWWVTFWTPYYSLFMARARNRRTKIILLCHNVQDHESNCLSKFGAKMIFKRADGFIVQSSDEVEKLQSLLRYKPQVEIHPHPTYSFYNRGKWDKAKARKSLGIPNDKKLILFFGYVRKYKGVANLINAMRQLRPSFPLLQLLVVGEIWKDDPQYKDMSEELGLTQHISFVDDYVAMDDIERYFKAVDFVVLPYTAGTGSGVLQLAFGMHKPVIATNIPAFSETIEDGKNGLLIAPNSPKEIANAITKMYQNNLWQKMENTLINIDPNESWDQLVEKIESLAIPN